MTEKILFWGIVIFLFVTLGIGVLASKKIKGDSVNYLVAGRGLVLPLAAATLMAQSVDSNATLGNTDLTSNFGFWAGASLPVGLALCLFLAGVFFAKPLNRMKLITLPDFYRVKYGRTVEVIASLLMVLSFAFLLAGNLVAGGVLFETFLGTTYTGGVMMLAIIVFIYTVMGGLFAVAYTDVVQVAVALIGSLILIGFVGVNFGLSMPPEVGPFAFDQLTQPASGAVINWATILALGFGNLAAIDFMARIFAAETPETAQRACLFASGGTLLVGIPFSIIALSAGSILESVGAPTDGAVLLGLIQNVIPPVLGLIILAAIISASLSTGDGAILGTSSVLAHNVLGIRHDAMHGPGGDKLLNLTRVMAIVITALGIFFALRVPETGILLVLAFDMMMAGVVVPLAGGLFWPKANRYGALACIITGSLLRLLLFVLMPTAFGADNTLLYIPNPVFTPDFDGFPTLISPLVGLVVFVVVSLMTQGRDRPRPLAIDAGAEAESLIRR